MLGAIVGDVIGSPFEFDFNREEAHSKKFPLVSQRSCVTDDSIMTLAIADAVMKTMPNRGKECTEDSSFNARIWTQVSRYELRFRFRELA